MFWTRFLILLAGSALLAGCASSTSTRGPAMAPPRLPIEEESRFELPESQTIGLIRYFNAEQGLAVINSSRRLNTGETVIFRDSSLKITGRGQITGTQKEAFYAVRITEGNPATGQEVLY